MKGQQQANNDAADVVRESLISIKALETLLTSTSVPIDEILGLKRTAAEQFEIEIQKRGTQSEDVLNLIHSLEDNFTRKLYRQFVDDVTRYLGLPCERGQLAVQWAVNEDAAAAWKDKVDFLVHVIGPHQANFGSMVFDEIVQEVVKQGEGVSAVKFAEAWIPSIRNDRNSLLLLRSIQVFHLIRAGFVKECTEVVEDVLLPTVLATFGLPVQVVSAFYRSCTSLYLELKHFDDVYKYGMLYLACTPIKQINRTDSIQLAYFLCLAAITSVKGHSFVELRQHPLLESLSDESVKERWILELVEIIDSGNQKEFSQFAIKHADDFANAGMADNIDFIWNKVKMFALLSLAFNRPADEKSLTFAVIAKHCQVEDNEVEGLVMEAMCHGLVEGTLDGISKKVAITSIQPRLLNPESVRSMADRFMQWSRATHQMSKALSQMASLETAQIAS